MKYLSLFSGIGAPEKALDSLGVGFDLVAFCEKDPSASKSYCAIHGVDESKNLGDITKVDETKLPKDIDILTYGFPCQDISISGEQKGFYNEDGSLTRSGLFFEALRIVEATKPKIAIAENVKNLTSKKFAKQFQIVLDSIESAGYINYWAVLNAKDYGVPQNRERVFIVSVMKDVDNGLFRFPEGFGLKKRLKDVLEDVVDEKYYLNAQQLRTIQRYEKSSNTKHRDGGTVEQVAQLYSMSSNPQSGRIYDPDGISPTLDTCGGGNRMPKILEKATAAAIRGRYGEDGFTFQNVEISDREYANTITTVQKDSMVWDGQRIRKLTPKECFRLMGFDDADFEKAEAVVSNTQLYKQAGNSIVVPVLEHIFRAILKAHLN